MKKIISILLVIIVANLAMSCEDAIESVENDHENNSGNFTDKEQTEPDDKTPDSIIFNEDVIRYGTEMNAYFSILDENILQISSDIPSNQIPKVGDIIYYNSNIATKGIFIGKVLSITDTTSGWVITTELPMVEELFKQLDIDIQMDSSNTVVMLDEIDKDNVISCSVVENTVWDSIETIYNEGTTNDSKAVNNSINTRSQSFPLNVTLKFEVKNEYFKGDIFVGIKGHIYITKLNECALDVNMRVGLKGTLGIGASGKKEFPFLPKFKKGVTLYNNRILGLRFVPEFKFFTDGSIKVEAGLNYEMMNTDIKFLYSGDNFTNNSAEQLHDNYFRVKNLHSTGKFGLALGGNLYAFLFTDNFFSAGANVSAGVELKGEKNVGIQFPGLANFDFSVKVSPLVKMTPFVCIRKTGSLEKKEGPTISLEVEPFKIDLLPNIHDIHYKNSAEEKKLSITGNIRSQKTSFIESKQEGIALFKKDENQPLELSVIQNGTRASIGNILFNISDDIDYEISPYIITMNDDVVYGDRTSINKSDENIKRILIGIYNECSGKSWKYQENWCTDAPITEWEGISYDKSNDWYYFDFIKNNGITGTINIDSCEQNIVIDGMHSDTPINMRINNCYNSSIIFFDSNFSELNCNNWVYSNLVIENCSISKLNCTNLYTNDKFGNCHEGPAVLILDSQIDNCSFINEAVPKPGEEDHFFGQETIEIGGAEIETLITDFYHFVTYYYGEYQFVSNKIESLHIEDGSLWIDKESLKYVEAFYLDNGSLRLFDKECFNDDIGIDSKRSNIFSLQMTPQIKNFYLSGYCWFEYIDLRSASHDLSDFTINSHYRHYDDDESLPKVVVYLDESMNNFNLSLHGRIFHQMLPQCYLDREDNGKTPKGKFSYDDKYTYYWIDGKRFYETRDYGWWHPDEPYED